MSISIACRSAHMCPAVSPRSCDPLAIACQGAMTQRAVRCPNVRVLLGNGREQVLGAELLCLLVAAHLGDAMEQDMPLGTAELCRGAGWSASIQGWERFLSESALAGEKSLQGPVPNAERRRVAPLAEMLLGCVGVNYPSWP